MEVMLVLVAVDKFNPQNTKFLLGEGNKFPARLLDVGKEKSKEVALKLMEDYAGVARQWATFNYFGIQEEEKVQLIYSAMIPESTRVRLDKSHWESYKNLTGPVKEIADKVLWRSI